MLDGGDITGLNTYQLRDGAGWESQTLLDYITDSAESRQQNYFVIFGFDEIFILFLFSIITYNINKSSSVLIIRLRPDLPLRDWHFFHLSSLDIYVVMRVRVTLRRLQSIGLFQPEGKSIAARDNMIMRMVAAGGFVLHHLHGWIF